MGVMDGRGEYEEEEGKERREKKKGRQNRRREKGWKEGGLVSLPFQTFLLVSLRLEKSIKCKRMYLYNVRI